MIAAGLDARAEHGEERQARDPEPVGPLRPDPRLVDERLADVEDDGLDRHSESTGVAGVRGEAGGEDRSART